MTIEQFRQSVRELEAPSEQLSLPLQALWWSEKGDWEKSHDRAQIAKSSDGDWVHAYLHRFEGDESNASYWYGVSGKTKPTCSLEAEWLAIVETLLSQRT